MRSLQREIGLTLARWEIATQQACKAQVLFIA